MENKHYEFTAAVDLLTDIEVGMGKTIIEGANAFYLGEQTKLDDLGTELARVVDAALADGEISTEDTLKITIDGVEIELNEQEAINQLQAKIAEITNTHAQIQSEASAVMLDIKWGNGNLTPESNEAFIADSSEMITNRLNALDEAFNSAVQGLLLQYPDKGYEYEEALQALTADYNSQKIQLTSDVMGTNFRIAGDAYSGILGKDAANDIAKATRAAIDEKIFGNGDGAESWSDEYLAKVLSVDVSKIEGATAANLRDLIDAYVEQFGLGLETEAFSYEATLGIGLWAVPEIHEVADILVEDFGIPEELSDEIALLLTADEEILDKIDAKTLADEFGIPESVAEDILVKLKAAETVEDRAEIIATDLIDKTEVSADVKVNIRAKLGQIFKTGIDKVKGFFGFGGGSKFRGGVVGGPSSMSSYFRGGIAGYSDGGMVRGGSQLIEVAEEGSPEMIIPLSSQRRGRALKLWAQAGNIMGVPGFARGGLTNGAQDEGFRFQSYSSSDTSVEGQPVQVDIGGLTFEINVNGSDGKSVTEAIKAQAAEIAETVAGVLADTLGAQFENTPARGGVA